MKNQLLLIVLISTLVFSCSKTKNKEVLKQHEPISSITSNISKLDSLLSTYEKNGDFMGSITLSNKMEIIYTNAIGFSDVETGKKSDIYTKYRIGSITKIYTAVLIFKAIEDNKLTLEQTIERYFPKLKNANKITIAQLLQHRSGIKNITSDPDFFIYHTEYKSPDDLVEIISNYDSDFEPNTTGDYSNSNYILLSQVLEKVYNQSYEDILQEKIITPLDLKNTYQGSIVTLENNESNSYTYTTEWAKSSETHMSIALGAGSIVSSPSDVALFMEALFNKRLLSPQSLEKMQTIRDTYGMGLVRYTIADKRGFGHGGSIDGYKSKVVYFPKEQLSLVVTSNGSNNNMNRIYQEILKLYIDEAPIEVTEDEVKKYAGIYVTSNDKSNKFEFIQDKNVLVHLIKKEFREPLVYKGNNRFVFEQISAESFAFTFSADGNQVTVEQGDYKGVYIKE